MAIYSRFNECQHISKIAKDREMTYNLKSVLLCVFLQFFSPMVRLYAFLVKVELLNQPTNKIQ